MTVAAFPFVGVAFAMLVALPACALLAKGLLFVLDRWGETGGLQWLAPRYGILVGGTSVPLAWLLSASVHQAKSEPHLVPCLSDSATANLEAALFSGLLAFTSFCLARRRRAQAVPVVTQREDRGLDERIGRLTRERTGLWPLRGRVSVVDGPLVGPIVTVGMLRPRVYIEALFAERLDDAELAGALAHELAHVRSFDPLRYALLALAVRLCPFGKALLGREAARWLFAREAHCDREAIRFGAEPAALAQALVAAARPASCAHLHAGLGTQSIDLLDLRVKLLLSYSARAPEFCRGHRISMGLRFVVATLIVAIVLPHVTGTHALDAIHSGAEGLLAPSAN